jgi:hypothetical protein
VLVKILKVLSRVPQSTNKCELQGFLEEHHRLLGKDGVALKKCVYHLLVFYMAMCD